MAKLVLRKTMDTPVESPQVVKNEAMLNLSSDTYADLESKISKIKIGEKVKLILIAELEGARKSKQIKYDPDIQKGIDTGKTVTTAEFRIKDIVLIKNSKEKKEDE